MRHTQTLKQVKKQNEGLTCSKILRGKWGKRKGKRPKVKGKDDKKLHSTKNSLHFGQNVFI